jgi:hypothetical protein
MASPCSLDPAPEPRHNSALGTAGLIDPAGDTIEDGSAAGSAPRAIA